MNTKQIAADLFDQLVVITEVIEMDDPLYQAVERCKNVIAFQFEDEDGEPWINEEEFTAKYKD